MKILILIALSLPLVACKKSERELFKEDQTRVATEVEKLLTPHSRVTLYSLDPVTRVETTKTDDQIFHGYDILGKTELSDPKEKSLLLKSFAQGVRESNGMVAACFDPRHGIRIVSDSSTSDFVICFSCGSVRPRGFHSDEGFLTSNSAKDLFNAFLDEYHLPKALEESDTHSPSK